MATAAGRGIRIVAGVALIAWGVAIGGTAGVALAVVGLVPIYAGVANVCLIAPILRAPFRGADAHKG